MIRADSLRIGEITASAVDLFGNLYLCDQQGQLFKIEPRPLRILHYSGRQTLGFDRIDAGSFSKIAVFSMDLQTVRFFDKNLNPLSELSLSPGLASSVTCICLSSDNKLWIFDETGRVLEKIDPATARVILTIDCSTVLKTARADVADMREYKNRLYMLDGDKNVYVFNSMGNLLRTFTIRGNGNLQFHDDDLISLSSGYLNLYNLDSGSLDQKPCDPALGNGYLFFSENYIYEVSKNIVIRPVSNGYY